MGHNLRRNILSPSPDPEATVGCGLTQTNSDSSAITANACKEPSRLCKNARLLGPLTQWTDEKHSMYLDSLEASFVTELQRSMHMRARCLEDKTLGPYPSEEPRAKTCNSSDLFVVLRDGCWQKINYKSNDSFLDSTADSHVVLDSPWIRHFTSAGKRRCVRSAGTHEHGVPCDEGICLKGNLPSGSSRGLEQHSLCHQRQQDLIGNTTEVSDQNFSDEDQGEKSSCASVMKMLMTTTADESSNVQIVPFGKFHTKDASAVNNASLGEETRTL
ncbi:cold-regulated protein 27 [Juglans microcarpa x Juglans regia]|uniref:cold-regulated protein 27 n=1 Tax=Juglans microcarpa x Juglans regia TaxID=2249226 RepID=UPI001B7DB8C3|nr:cold-regulated protein 27 [Juglans microcarpa x Juglans regia]